jgi:hypothetical protein
VWRRSWDELEEDIEAPTQLMGECKDKQAITHAESTSKFEEGCHRGSSRYSLHSNNEQPHSKKAIRDEEQQSKERKTMQRKAGSESERHSGSRESTKQSAVNTHTDRSKLTRRDPNETVNECEEDQKATSGGDLTESISSSEGGDQSRHVS